MSHLHFKFNLFTSSNKTQIFCRRRGAFWTEYQEVDPVASVEIEKATLDLFIPELFLSKTVVSAGEIIKANGTVKNKGFFDAPNSIIKYYYSKNYGGEDMLLASKAVNALKVNESTSVAQDLVIPTNLGNEGYITGVITVNSGFEANTENNKFTVRITKEESDLVIVSAKTNIASVAAGKDVKLEFQIKNQGNIKAMSSDLYIYLGKTSNDKKEEITTIKIQELAPNVSKNYSKIISIPKSTSEGKYYLILEADGNGKIDESDEDNNLKSCAITVNTDGLPDLIVEEIEMISNGTPVSDFASFRRGESASGTIYYKNIGNASAGSSQIDLFFSDSQEYEAYNWINLIPSISTSYINSGGGVSSMFTVQIPSDFYGNDLSSGYYYIHAKINPSYNIKESKEDNNHKTVKIYVYGGGSSVKSLKLPIELGVKSLVGLESKISEIEVYPNPSKGKFKIDISNESINRIEIFNGQGQLLYDENIKNTGIYNIDLEKYSSGTYYLILWEETEKLVKKLIVL